MIVGHANQLEQNGSIRFASGDSNKRLYGTKTIWSDDCSVGFDIELGIWYLVLERNPNKPNKMLLLEAHAWQ